ncbi:hypothetical protein H107_03820 [Trichophyton rubrum CBS 202.88]|nr:hypothetical protein H107_03820 [Trichophyton rubrum CBS 202.88]
MSYNTSSPSFERAFFLSRKVNLRFHFHETSIFLSFLSSLSICSLLSFIEVEKSSGRRHYAPLSSLPLYLLHYQSIQSRDTGRFEKDLPLSPPFFVNLIYTLTFSAFIDGFRSSDEPASSQSSQC